MDINNDVDVTSILLKAFIIYYFRRYLVNIPAAINTRNLPPPKNFHGDKRQSECDAI